MNGLRKSKKLKTASVASVSVGLSAGLMHFALFEHAKIGRTQESASCARPNFCGAKKQKIPRAKYGNACYAD